MDYLPWRDKILLYLLAVGAVVEDFAYHMTFDFPNRGHVSFHPFSFGQSDYFKDEPRLLRDALRDLTRKKLVEVSGKRGEKLFRLNHGGLEHLLNKFPTLKYRQCKWDGLWRLVVYDISEGEKNLRARLRTKLRRLGFIFVQKSVWVCPFPVDQELETFLKASGLWGRILLFKATLPEKESRRLLLSFQPGNLTATGPTQGAFIKPIRSLFQITPK